MKFLELVLSQLAINYRQSNFIYSFMHKFVSKIEDLDHATDVYIRTILDPHLSIPWLSFPVQQDPSSRSRISGDNLAILAKIRDSSSIAVIEYINSRLSQGSCICARARVCVSLSICVCIYV